MPDFPPNLPHMTLSLSIKARIKGSVDRVRIPLYKGFGLVGICAGFRRLLSVDKLPLSQSNSKVPKPQTLNSKSALESLEAAPKLQIAGPTL